jgi:hypothetical protein
MRAMRAAGTRAPAFLWRAFFVLLCVLGIPLAAAPASAPPELSQMGKPNAAEAARLLQQFRQAGIPGQYFLQFELQARPRGKPERVFQGRLWGGRNEMGAVSRVEIIDAEGVTHRLLIQNGEHGGVWRLTDGRSVALGFADLFAPLVPGVDLTAFDVQMPFLYWPDATLEKVTRSVLGRPAYAFLVKVPAAFAPQYAGIGAARAYLDTQFNALIQTELLGPTGKVTKSFAFVSLKKVGDQYIPKEADYRNEITRDKTRLQITGAALHQRFSPDTFIPGKLGQAVPPAAPADIVRIEP